DPGGRGANGVSVLSVDGLNRDYRTALVDSVDEALAWFREQLGGSRPTALGIDTYLFWETGPQGWRKADLWLRERYPAVANSVFASNSAYGAMAVQGMSLAILARQLWPEIGLVEAHPKVLYHSQSNRRYAWPGDMAAWLTRRVGAQVSADLPTEHE